MVALLPLTLAYGPARAIDCTDFLRMHGMLRQAQAQCTFESFNPEIVDTARRCFDQVGSGKGARAIRAGAKEFDRLADLRGRNAACALIKRNFPMVIR
ncbi:hypothetical protein GCM10007890_36300 [Methylobacterium tardum]|uniref:Uncharacterized protein n=1 Tax=Methylobacterium tardum TaxID=374432 RepID=A0AA37TGL4_9HYPH|nr:hypothetical protein GCM10007890_36300 [Methylobacterium tardum]